MSFARPVGATPPGNAHILVDFKDGLQAYSMTLLLNDFHCQWRGCSMKYSQATELWDHVRQHIFDAGLNPSFKNTCLQCGKFYGSSDNLTQHQSSHATIFRIDPEEVLRAIMMRSAGVPPSPSTPSLPSSPPATPSTPNPQHTAPPSQSRSKGPTFDSPRALASASAVPTRPDLVDNNFGILVIAAEQTRGFEASSALSKGPITAPSTPSTPVVPITPFSEPPRVVPLTPHSVPEALRPTPPQPRSVSTATVATTSTTTTNSSTLSSRIFVPPPPKRMAIAASPSSTAPTPRASNATGDNDEEDDDVDDEGKRARQEIRDRINARRFRPPPNTPEAHPDTVVRDPGQDMLRMSRKRKGGPADGDPSRKYRCTFPGCLKRFRRKAHLERHVEQHKDKDTRPRFPCLEPGCVKSYSTKYDLTAHHNRFHKKQSLFKCPKVGCCRRFVHQVSLDKHLVEAGHLPDYSKSTSVAGTLLGAAEDPPVDEDDDVTALASEGDEDMDDEYDDDD